MGGPKASANDKTPDETSMKCHDGMRPAVSGVSEPEQIGIGVARSVDAHRKERRHMTYAAPMVQGNPSKPPVDVNALVECIRACFDCAQACTADVDADLGEQQHLQEMVRCIRLCL